MHVRILIYIGLIGVAYMLPWWIFLFAAVPYVLRWTGYELLVLAVLVDIQFGLHGMLFGYLYTIGVGTLIVLTTLLKPQLRFYA